MRKDIGGVAQVKEDRRRYPRWAVGGRLTGQIVDYIPKVSVIDISLGGVLIEHTSPVEAGVISFLNMLLPGHEVTLKSRVVRSGVYRSEVRSTGEREHIYRTGLEFLDLTEASLRLINGYIEFLRA